MLFFPDKRKCNEDAVSVKQEPTEGGESSGLAPVGIPFLLGRGGCQDHQGLISRISIGCFVARSQAHKTSFSLPTKGRKA